MSAIIDAIRRVVAEDSVHDDVRHEAYLTRATVENIKRDMTVYRRASAPGSTPYVCGLPLHVQNVGRDCIATIRGGQIISVTNL